MLGNSNWLTIYTFLMEPIKYCMMLQKDSLVRFWLDNLPSISGSKLYIGLLPVRIRGKRKKRNKFSWQKKKLCKTTIGTFY